MSTKMMATSGISKEFWVGVATAEYLLDISPTKAIKNQKPRKAENLG